MEFSLKGYIKQGYYVVQKLVGASTKLVYKGAFVRECWKKAGWGMDGMNGFTIRFPHFSFLIPHSARLN